MLHNAVVFLPFGVCINVIVAIDGRWRIAATAYLVQVSYILEGIGVGLTTQRVQLKPDKSTEVVEVDA